MKPFNNILLGGLSILLSSTSISDLSDYFKTVTPISSSYSIASTDPDCVNDDDSDGVCNKLDCAPNNPNLPARPGAACDDNNEFTKNDRVQADGCTCIGTNKLVDKPIMIDAGPDVVVAKGKSIDLSVNVLQQNTCITTNCNNTNQLLAHWNMDNCVVLGKKENALDYSKFTQTEESSIFCAGIVTNGIYRKNGLNSCADITATGKTGNALSLDMPNIEEFKNNHPQALRFDIILDPSDDISRITKLEFMEKSPQENTPSNNITEINNYPTKYGIRILKGGRQIYKATDIPTGDSWAKASFDFSNEPIFEVTSTAVITVELLAYGSNNKGAATAIWNLDDLKVFGDCCTSRSFHSSRYNWSTGARTSKINVTKPGTYTVTVTDCNGTQATDEVIVKLKENEKLSITNTSDREENIITTSTNFSSPE